MGKEAHVHLRAVLAVGLLGLAGTPFLVGFSDERPEHDTGRGTWRFRGGNVHNTHHAEQEVTIDRDNVGALRPRWVFKASGAVSAIPTVVEDQVYFTDWGSPLGSLDLPPGGRLYALDAYTGEEIWSRRISEYQRNNIYNLSRSSPAIDGDRLYIADLLGAPLEVVISALGVDPSSAGTSVYAIDRRTGDLIWKTVVDSHPLAHVTQSPVVHAGRVYVGISGKESAAARLPYPCCTFRGSMVALDAQTGEILWKTYTVPDNGGERGGYSGAAIWGSAPTIDVERNVLYTGTGQNYDVPEDLKECMVRFEGDPEAQRRECIEVLESPDNHAISILAFDLDTGAIRWRKKMLDYSAWNFACSALILPYLPTNPFNCPTPEGGDFDFGQSPMLLTADPDEGPRRDILAVGQKTGIFWALDPDREGEVIWSTRVGPGGVEGGILFGSATDGERIYTQITNIEHTPFELVAGSAAGQVVNGGIWAALDADDGRLLWQTPDPSSFLPLEGGLVHPVWGAGLGEGFFGVPLGPLTVSNGVLYGGSLDKVGHMYAFDARSGEILWRFESGGSVGSAPSIVNGTLFWGSGYPVAGYLNDELYAFELAP